MFARTLPVLLTVALIALIGAACSVNVNQGGAGDPKPNGQDGGGAEEAGGEGGEGGAIAEPDKPARADPEAGLADCPADAGADVYCTESGKLAGQWAMVDLVRVPAEAQTVFESAPELEGQPSLTIATQGERVYIRHVSCGSCRRVMGQGFEGAPGHMSEDQLRAMQAKLGLGDDAPLLDSVEAWTAFAGDPRGSGMLTELAKQTEG